MKNTRAFTVVEMLVSISIITIITGVLLYNYPKFNQHIYMNRAARALASTLRDAQNRASSVVELSPGVFPSNYGVQIKQTPPSFTLFTDKDTDQMYDVPPSPPPPPERIKPFQFENGIKISQIIKPNGLPMMGMGAAIHVLYYRPEPKTFITGPGGALLAGGVAGEGYAIIVLASADSSITKQVQIWTTGQISIQ